MVKATHNRMKLVITGGAGFIGSHIAEFLIKKGYSITIVDNFDGGNVENLNSIKNKIEFCNLDILNYDALLDVVKDAECIFHEAALTSVKDSFLQEKKYFDVNVTGTENVLKAAQKFGSKVIFASSASVYGNPQIIPIKENSIRKPLNPYGVTKMKAEDVISKYVQQGTSVVVLRYFNVYGPGQNPSYAGVITKFLANIKNQDPVIIHGDGLQVRDFVHVNDVVQANFLAMNSEINHGIVNIGSGIPTSINDIAEMMISASDLKINLVHDDVQPGDIRFSQADIELAKELLGWKPQIDLKDWLKSAIKSTL